MKKIPAALAAGFVIVGAELTGLFGCAKKGGTSFEKLLARRPAPDINTLAERSAVDRTGEDAMDAFYDILKLRKTRESNAVPVLEHILADHANSLRIHGYAAAQALFCIGTPEAHAVLARYLLSTGYDASLGINYAFHWQMDEAKRDGFIERYHLTNLSNDLLLKIEAESKEEGKRRWLAFTLTMKNISDKPLRIRDQRMYLDQRMHLGSLLFFRSADGRYARTLTKRCRLGWPPRPKWIELKPAATRQVQIDVDVKRAEGLGHAYPLLSKGATLALDTDDVAFDTVGAGEFSVCAMLEVTAQTAAQIKVLGCAKPWSGRAVSEPVLVTVLEPPR